MKFHHIGPLPLCQGKAAKTAADPADIRSEQKAATTLRAELAVDEGAKKGSKTPSEGRICNHWFWRVDRLFTFLFIWTCQIYIASRGSLETLVVVFWCTLECWHLHSSLCEGRGSASDSLPSLPIISDDEAEAAVFFPLVLLMFLAVVAVLSISSWNCLWHTYLEFNHSHIWHIFVIFCWNSFPKAYGGLSSSLVCCSM